MIDGRITGDSGSKVVANTDAVVGKFFALQVITDAVITALTAPYMEDANSLAGITLVAGTVIYTNITAIALTSGVVILYKQIEG